MGENKENKRTSNFTTLEESTLIGLVAKYKDIIESKKTDSEVCRKKKEIWKQVAQEFNSICGGTYRTSDVLLNKYRNLKKRSKKKFADEKCYTQGTGGGPPKKIIITDTDVQLKDILGTQITGFTSKFDDDLDIPIVTIENEEGSHPNQAENDHTYTFTVGQDPGSTNVEDNGNLTNASPSAIDSEEPSVGDTRYLPDIAEALSTSSQQILRTFSEIRNDPSTSNFKDWSTKLKTPRSRILNPRRHIGGTTSRSKLANGLCSWVNTKSQNVSLEAEIMVEQHKLYMKHMQEKHELEMRIAEEEHKLRIEILKKQLNNEK